MQEINPSTLYSVSFFAREVAGIHPVTVYQSLAGLKKFHLPEALKLGRSVRFSGASILAWRAALPAYGAAAMAQAQAQQTQKAQLSNARDQDGADQTPKPVTKRLGRPTKAAQLARREAASRALAMGGAA